MTQIIEAYSPDINNLTIAAQSNKEGVINVVVLGPPGISSPVGQFNTVSIISQTITQTDGNLQIDRNQGEYVKLILNSNISTFIISNWPAVPYLGRIHLDIYSQGNYSINAWPVGSLFSTSQPPLTAPYPLTPGGNDFFVLTTIDAGATIKVSVVGLDWG